MMAWLVGSAYHRCERRPAFPWKEGIFVVLGLIAAAQNKETETRCNNVATKCCGRVGAWIAVIRWV